MKHRLFFKFLVPFLTFLSVQPRIALCQESIEKIISEYSKESIIREINNAEWLVYSNPGYCDFSKIVLGNTYIDILRLPENVISVADFEISGGRVYLCGMLNTGKAYMGYFELSYFPYSSLIYFEIPNIVNVKKLEVLPASNTESNPLCQVIMTGIDDRGIGFIIDAVPSSASWDVYKIHTYHPDYFDPIYEDIAIVKKYIVITSCDCPYVYDELDEETKCTGTLWYFIKPATPTTPLIYSQKKARSLHYVPTSPFLIAKCEDSTFVTATQSAVGDIYTSEFSGLNITGTAILHTDTNVLMDFTYNHTSHSTEIVVDNIGYQCHESSIYTIYPPMYILSGTAGGIKFPKYTLNSLRYLNHNIQHFIGSGYYNSNYSDLFLFHYYNNSIVQECAEVISIETSPLEKGITQRPFYWYYSSTNQINPEITETIRKGTDKETICGDLKK